MTRRGPGPGAGAVTAELALGLPRPDGGHRRPGVAALGRRRAGPDRRRRPGDRAGRRARRRRRARRWPSASGSHPTACAWCVSSRDGRVVVRRPGHVPGPGGLFGFLPGVDVERRGGRGRRGGAVTMRRRSRTPASGAPPPCWSSRAWACCSSSAARWPWSRRWSPPIARPRRRPTWLRWPVRPRPGTVATRVPQPARSPPTTAPA